MHHGETIETGRANNRNERKREGESRDDFHEMNIYIYIYNLDKLFNLIVVRVLNLNE